MAKNPLFTFTASEYDYLAEGLNETNKRLSPYSCNDSAAIRDASKRLRPDDEDRDLAIVRPPFLIDVDRILNNPFYNRASDKTQVFSFYRNDDITHRSYHLQLVAQTAKKIGRALRLNCDLIEAIALGHDAGHTPFGHRGEEFLSAFYHAHTGRYFSHNVHSVRALQDVARCDLTLQTYDGILCHCGEKAFLEYHPSSLSTFAELEALVEDCYIDQGNIRDLRPCTLEGCVVRICDILAYIGKDRQDALSAKLISPEDYFVKESVLGSSNREILKNSTANIIKNSMGKGYLAMSPEVFDALDGIRKENFELIYSSEEAGGVLDTLVEPMMAELYERFLDDIARGDESSPVFDHHINAWFMRGYEEYRASDPNDIVADYIASMTDDYFIDLYRYLFPDDPKSKQQVYHPYF